MVVTIPGTIQGQVKQQEQKPNDQHLEQVITITAHYKNKKTAIKKKKKKWPTLRVDNRLLFLKENNNKLSKIQSHKM